MNRLCLLFSVLIVSVLLFVACSKDSGKGSSGSSFDCTNNTSKSFAANVNPIVQATCNTVSCHATGSTNGPGPLTNYTQVSSNASIIRAAIIAGTMPQNTTLSSAQKSSIVCWIDSGFPNN